MSLATLVRVKSEPHQTWHGDRGPRACSCTTRSLYKHYILALFSVLCSVTEWRIVVLGSGNEVVDIRQPCGFVTLIPTITDKTLMKESVNLQLFNDLISAVLNLPQWLKVRS